jgi:hypothetical protein
MSLLARRYLLLLILMALPATGQAREIVGWVEKVRLYPWDIVAKARIDTGAKTSSMGVDALKYFYRNNEQWVRFTATNFKDVTIEIERKVIRISKIKDPYGKLIQRPVVNIGICLGGYYENAEVNLAIQMPCILIRPNVRNRKTPARKYRNETISAGIVFDDFCNTSNRERSGRVDRKGAYLPRLS